MSRTSRGPIIEGTRTRLHGLSDLYPDGILGAESTEGRVTLINAQAARFLDVDPQRALGAPLVEVLRLKDNRDRSWVDVNHPFDSIGIRVGVPEQSWLNSGGQEVLTTARLIRSEHLGPVEGVAISLRSGRGRARLDSERSDLVATVSHELRSPLSGVKGFVQVMLNRWDDLKDDQKKLMLRTVHSDADRLSRLITELLDVARIDTGRLSIAPRPVDVALLIERCSASVRATTSRPVVVEVEPGTPDIWADPDKFTQVLTNLLENGIRHGEGTVTVTAAPDRDGVRIAVCDEGAGIEPEKRKRVFTKYWTGGSGGSGLGLYIAAGLVRVHAGTLEIGDAPGGGARIEMTWPRAPLD